MTNECYQLSHAQMAQTINHLMQNIGIFIDIDNLLLEQLKSIEGIPAEVAIHYNHCANFKNSILDRYNDLIAEVVAPSPHVVSKEPS